MLFDFSSAFYIIKLVLEFVLEFSVQRRITGQTVEGTRVPQVEEVCLMLLFMN